MTQLFMAINTLFGSIGLYIFLIGVFFGGLAWSIVAILRFLELIKGSLKK